MYLFGIGSPLSLLTSVEIAQEIGVSPLWSTTAPQEGGSPPPLQGGDGSPAISHRTCRRVLRMSNGNVAQPGMGIGLYVLMGFVSIVYTKL